MTSRFLVAAARYRRFAERAAAEVVDRTWALDFSETALRTCYEYETYGQGKGVGIFSEGSINGYQFGKSCVNLALTAWKTGLLEGVLTKHELLTDPRLADERAWLREALRDVVVGPHALARPPC